jgi:hypothetical membrane protein
VGDRPDDEENDMTVIERTARQQHCDRESRVTKSLLGYGVIAGPIYVAASLAQALTRQGFDLTRHAWSLLSQGAPGWIQVINFVLAGLMTVAAAVGLRRAGTGRWLPRLIGAYGVSLVAAGVFRADPALGFPAGTPADAHAVSWHGALHLLAGGIGFGCLIAACLVAGRAFARRGDRGWAVYSRVTGVVFLAAFAGIASGSQGVWTTLPFTAAVVLAWSWISTLSVRTYRRSS